MPIRDYQLDAVIKIFEQFQTVQRTLCVMATGAGKTQTAGYVAKEILARKLGRVMVVCHREELIRQAAHRFEQITGIKPEIEKADEWAGELDAYGKCPIVVASVQTLVSGRGTKRYTRFDPAEFAFLWVDESHRSVCSTFTEVITHFCKNPKLKCLGVTATPDRADKEALGQIFQSVAFEFELPDIIEQGYLVPIKQRSVEIDGLDFSHVRTTAGDLNSGDLEEAMLFERPLHGTAFATIELSCGLANGTLSEIGEAGLRSSKVVELIGTNHRRKTLIFCTTVAHANRMADILNRWLPQSAVDVNGEMAKETRHKNITAFTKGNAQFLVNCMVLTEGADLPVTEIVVMARPTKSRALFSQMLGRGTRPAADIADVLGLLPDAAARRKLIELSSKPFMEVLDFVGNNGRHQLVSTVDVLGDADSPEVLELAKEYANTGKDVLASLKDAREEIERRKIESEKQKKKREEERQRAQEAEIARRAKLVANADYRVTDHDPYAPQYDLELRDASVTEMAEVMQFCKDNLHKSQYAKVTLDNARKVKADILRRKYARLASWKQIRILEQNGWTREQTINMPLAQAGAIMDQLFESWGKKA